MTLRFGYIGNFGPEHSTENHIRTALIGNGHTVETFQENKPAEWRRILNTLAELDVILWTRTGWEWDRIHPRGRPGALKDQRRMLQAAKDAGVPVVGYHLDIWFGLKREYQIDEEPFFRSDVVITADGGHNDRWAEKQVNHVWYPPAVSQPQCEIGVPRDEYRSPLAFVGSWQGGYHDEHQHRFELVRWLQTNFPKTTKFWPRKGEPSIRGRDLQDLYASVDLVIGDSCFAGHNVSRYWSDRIPETLGRGGALIHPNVPGLDEQFIPGRHLLTWDAGQWDALGASIETALAQPALLQELREAGRQWVLKHHTYEKRMTQLVELLQVEKLLL